MSVDQQQLLSWYRLTYLSRKIDEKAALYIRRGLGWSYHARCTGHEGIQVALGLAFRAHKDFLFPYYRDTATVLAAGMSALELIQNGLSKASDVGSGGRHMSNHFSKPAFHIQNVSSCTGNQTLHAVGVARAIKYYDDDAIAFSSQGDSSLSEGYCYEAINGASRERLPVIFVIQNNGYGISVPVSVQTANPIVVENFRGFKNLGIFLADGTDFEDSTQKINQALDFIKNEKCPALLHAQCVRIGAHSNSDAQELYRDEEELKLATKADPLVKLEALLKKQKISAKKIQEIQEDVDNEVNQACDQVEKEAGPSAESVTKFVFAKEYIPPKPEELYIPESLEPTEKLREAINRTLMEEFAYNPNTFLWGQDCASKKKGGVFNLTKGMLEKFGEKRVFNGPLAEDFNVGTANGMSRYRSDIRIVIEAAQFADYVWPAMEQIVEMGHDYWRSNGQFSPNVVMRLASGGYITGGLYHSQNVEAIMSHLPGLRVVYPAFADDAAGLLRTAIRSCGPTFFLEPKYLYNRTEARGPRYDQDFALPFGVGKIRRQGLDASIICYGNSVHMALKVAEDLAERANIEVFDLRSIKPLDYTGICATAKKTGKVLIIHEDHLFNGIGGEVSAVIMEQCFAYLDAPVQRLAARDIPIGFAKSLENAILPQVEDIKRVILELLAY
jgi:2-oxoisovalerate dehydrogenase E1 component